MRVLRTYGVGTLGKKPLFVQKTHLERIASLPDVFMLASLVQFKYVQTVGEPNDTNFKVGLAGGYEVLANLSNMMRLLISI